MLEHITGNHEVEAPSKFIRYSVDVEMRLLVQESVQVAEPRAELHLHDVQVDAALCQGREYREKPPYF